MMRNPVVNTPIKQSYDYDSYRDLVVSLAERSATTGEQLPERIEATKLNAHRMKRIDKQVMIQPELMQLVRGLEVKWDWIILAEPWCGDGAQNIPVISKIALENENIKLRLVLRDENPDLMDQHLTNGARAIPKLICYDSATGNVVGTWGARPAGILGMISEFKACHPGIAHGEFVKQLHLLYAQDRGQSIQQDFMKLLREWTQVKANQVQST